MDIEPTDVTPMDSGSDNLADFEKDFFNSPAEKEPAPVKEEVTPVEDDVTNDDEANDDQVEADDNLDGDDEPENKDEQPKPKKSNRFQERINELTAKAREAERALEEIRAERARQPDKPTANTPVVQDNEPKPTDMNEDGSDKYPLGEYDPEYIRDMARHTINREWAVKKEQEAQEQNQRQMQEARDQLQEQWTQKLGPVTEQHEDFLDKTMELEATFEGLDPTFSDYLVQTIKSLDHGPEVLYYFANNLDEAQKFVKSGPLGATLALGEINAMFKGQTRKETKVSKAPPPPQVNRGTNTRTAVPGDTDDLDAFEKEFFAKRR